MLRCLGNVICSGLDETASAACEKKSLFPALGRLLASEHQHIRKECLWVLSNITGINDLVKWYTSYKQLLFLRLMRRVVITDVHSVDTLMCRW